MKRFLLNFITAICVLCCIAILVLRSLSFRGQILAMYTFEDGASTLFWNESGNLIIEWNIRISQSQPWPISEAQQPFKWRRLAVNVYWYSVGAFDCPLPTKSFAGFGIEKGVQILDPTGKSVTRIETVSAPLWIFLFLFAIFPCIRLWKPLRAAHDRHAWMRRSISRGWTGVSIMSALGIIILIGIWIRSRYVGDQFSLIVKARSKLIMLEWGQGGMGWFSHELQAIELYQGNYLTPLDENYSQIKPPRYPNSMYPYGFAGGGLPWNRRATFVFQDMQFKGSSFRQVTLPIWSLICVAGILTVPGAAQLRRRIRSARLAPEGLCPTCGYDMRATRERCPECGRTTGGLVETPVGRG